MTDSNKKKPVDTLDFTTAVQLAESLHGIKNAPQRPGALQATVQDLQTWCTGVPAPQDSRPDRIVRYDGTNFWDWTAAMQAEWLVAEARREWDEWQGPRALRGIFDQKFRPVYKEFESFPVPLPPSCEACLDTGVVEQKGIVSDRESVYRWCSCKSGVEMFRLAPNYLDLCNRRLAVYEAAKRIPVPTQEEIDRIKAQQEANRKATQEDIERIQQEAAGRRER